MRCAPGYRHNDITGLIIGKPNRPNVQETDDKIMISAQRIFYSSLSEM